MKALFETIGPVAKVTMVVKGARHVATVIFKNGADAAKAQHKYHNIPLDGERMDITIPEVAAAPASANILQRLGLEAPSRMRSDSLRQ